MWVMDLADGTLGSLRFFVVVRLLCDSLPRTSA